MRFRVDKSVDCISHDGVRYVSNSETRELTVPDEAGVVLLRIGAGCVRIDKPPEPEGEVVMLTKEGATFCWRGKLYAAVDGIAVIPRAAVQEAIEHGFTLAEIEEPA